MKIQANETLDCISNCKHLEELETILPKIADSMGFNGVTYADITILPAADEPVVYLSTSVNSDFGEAYRVEGMVSADPIVRQAASSTIPFHWLECDDYKASLKTSPGVKSKTSLLVELAHDYGYEDGFVVPCHSKVIPGLSQSGIFSFFGKNAEIDQFDRHMLRLFCMHYHETISAILREQHKVMLPEPVDTKLTDRERDVLLWASQGKTNGEVADILGIGERTVKFHLCQAMAKLNVHNKVHAVAVAMRLGLIVP